MTSTGPDEAGGIARLTGVTLLSVIAIGIAGSVIVSGDININLNVDAAQIIGNMSDAVGRVYGKAWIAVVLALLDLLVAAGLFLLLRVHGRLAALWCLVMSVAGAIFVLQGGLETLKIATLLSSEGLASAAPDALKILQVGFLTGDYAAFHLGLVINAVAKAGFFFLFLRSGTIPFPIAGWGLFASLFVAGTVIGRDFLPALGHTALSIGFILSNLLAHLLLGGYLAFRGVRSG